ncbi:hypothetical protein [Microvirga arabica]|uniref:hypothetical protein n=1 Tax=Microvirga arabica TaxID=1128671 RepID=UPI00193A68C3|nr:hypothetical protein [Microvirga arabica]MBM1170614.1 hypothetical protein [Microvirga arabica]
MSEPVSHSSKAADYRRQAREIRNLAVQISLMDVRHELLETARRLEAFAADDEHQEAASEPLARDKKPTT